MLATEALHHAGVELRKVVRAETALHERFRRHVIAIVSATIVVDLACAVLAYLFERDADNSQVTGFGTALFWTTTQMLTVSSNVQNPLTTGGRILDVFMEIWAITIVATLTGSFGSFLVN